jgi:hypothetical protein
LAIVDIQQVPLTRGSLSEESREPDTFCVYEGDDPQARRRLGPPGEEVTRRSLWSACSVPRSTLVLFLTAAVALGGCAAGGGDTGTATTGSQRYFGDHPGQGATSLHLGRADCRALAATVSEQARQPVRNRAEPSPPNSRCQVTGKGIGVSITLDAANAARRRYSNRIAEQAQFNYADPRKLPHEVPGVGDPAAHNHYATWIPAFSTLWAVRGNRWLTVSYAIAGTTRPQRLAAATVLARQAFKLSAR